MPRYHREIGFPRGVNLPRGRHSLKASPHAIDEARKDGVSIPQSVNLDGCIPFELVTSATGHPTKVGYRTVLDARRDWCFVVSLDRTGPLRVLTSWVNDREDTHRTLRVNEYDRP